MSDESLESKIRGWLAKQGYPFELVVGRSLRTAGWGVDHAQLYTDPETGKIREIDVVAGVHTGQPDKGVVGINWVVECKSAADHPWIVFTSQPRLDRIPPSPTYFAPGMLGTAVLLDAMELGELVPTYQLPTQIGHGVVRAFTEGRTADPSGAYSALLGATAAANGLAREHGTFWLTHSRDLPVIKIFMPVVVVDGSLFEMELTEKGEERLREVGRSVVWCRNPGDTGATLVNVVTGSELSRFAKDSMRDSMQIVDRALTRAPEIWRKYQNRSDSVQF